MDTIAYLQLEIAATIWQLTIGMWVVTVLAASSYMLASSFGGDKHYRFSMVLVISGFFYIAREDYLMHRAAAYIARMSPSSGWEVYKAALISTWTLLPALDFLAGLVWIYIFWDSAKTLKTSVQYPDSVPGFGTEYPALRSQKRFLRWAKIGFFVGWLSPFAATFLASR